MNSCTGNKCLSLSECLVTTKNVEELKQDHSLQLTHRERQVLLLLASNETISRKAADKLAQKVSVEELMQAGLLEQANACSNFKHLLAVFSKPKQSATTLSATVPYDTLDDQSSNQPTASADQSQYEQNLYKKIAQTIATLYDDTEILNANTLPNTLSTEPHINSKHMNTEIAEMDPIVFLTANMD